MPRLRIRLTLLDLMGLVAVIALGFGVIPTEPAIAFSVVASLFTSATTIPAAARRLPRLTIAVGLYSFYPALPVLSLHATWATAWVVLGHAPRYWHEFHRLGPVVNLFDSLTGLLLTGCVPALVICVVLSYAGLIRTARGIAAGPFSIPPDRVDVIGFYSFIAIPLLGWGSFVLFWIVDPLRLHLWFRD